MKAQTGIGILFVALVCIMAGGCDLNSKKTVANDIVFDSIQVEKTYHLLENPDNPNCNLQIKFTYPTKIGNKEVLAAVQRQFIYSFLGETFEGMTPEEAITKYAAGYIASYKTLEVEYQKEVEEAKDAPVGSWFSYYEMSENEVTYNQNQLLCYTDYTESYTGGAHGAHTSNSYLIDLATGELVTEESIFIDNYQEVLAQLLVDKIAEQHQVADAKELENIGFFSIDEIYPNKNFSISDKGITYTFNEYEIAAYVVGIIQVELSFDELDLLLRKNSAIAHLLPQ